MTVHPIFSRQRAAPPSPLNAPAPRESGLQLARGLPFLPIRGRRLLPRRGVGPGCGGSLCAAPCTLRVARS